MMKINLLDVIQSVQPTSKPPRPHDCDFLSVDEFLDASVVVSNGAETRAAKMYADYQAFCDSRQVEAVNPTAFAVRVMNIYQGRGVERDEVMRDGKRTEIYRGLAFKGGPDEKVVSPQPPVQTDHDFLPDPDRSACPDVLIGGLRSVPEPPKAVPTDDADLRQRVWRMYLDLVHMTPDKIQKRAERWESLRMTREAELARRWMKFKEEQR